MSAFSQAVLANPGAWFAILMAIVSPLGAAIAIYRKERQSHRDCEIKCAQLTEQMSSAKDRIKALEGSVDTLTKLLKKEINIG